MSSEEIKLKIDECGPVGNFSFGDDRTRLAALLEIAYQVAVMNERSAPPKATPIPCISVQYGGSKIDVRCSCGWSKFLDRDLSEAEVKQKMEHVCGERE